MSAVTNETVIEYARISGADKGTGGTNARGGGVKLEGSSPI